MKVACIQLSSGENYKKNCSDIIKLIFKAINNPNKPKSKGAIKSILLYFNSIIQ